MFDRNRDKQNERPETPAPVAPAPAASTLGSVPPRAAAPSGSAKSAVLGATIRIKGDITGDENLLIEGQVDGSVTLNSHEVTVGRTGRVHADISAKIIRIDGEVQGDVTSREKVVLSSTSNTKGNIITPKMTLEEGARFKGTIDIDPGHANSAPASRPAAPQQQPAPAEKKPS